MRAFSRSGVRPHSLGKPSLLWLPGEEALARKEAPGRKGVRLSISKPPYSSSSIRAGGSDWQLAGGMKRVFLALFPRPPLQRHLLCHQFCPEISQESLPVGPHNPPLRLATESQRTQMSHTAFYTVVCWRQKTIFTAHYKSQKQTQKK